MKHLPRLLLPPLLLPPLLLIAGCAVGPDFKAPAAPDATRLTPTDLPDQTAGPTPQRFQQGGDIPAQWWTLFHNRPLNDLIEAALKNNPSVTAAQAALRQASENVLAQRGTYFPTVTLNPSISRNLTPTAAISPASATGNPYYTLITPQVSVSFVPDVFGANQRAVESLTAQAENQRYQLEATQLTLTANVANGAIQEAALRGQIKAAEDNIAIVTELLTILRRQYALGQITLADVAAQEAALAQARQALPPLQKQLAQQRDALIALTGRLPDQDLVEKFTLAALTLPTDLPVSLPSHLVEQRPDIKAAEATLHAASAQIGQAVAARLPQITLTANAGSSANTFATLFTPGTNFWTVAGSLTAPIFDAGTLLHKQRAAEAGFDQAAAQYRSTVQTAFQNVADALQAIHADADALKAATESEQAAGRALGIVQTQLKAGQVAYPVLLTAQQTLQTARLARVQAEASRFADTVALFQALGGGWWNRTDDALYWAPWND
jgi:NodT family efflux transporter outer membrane factor (OMF) lipoprotein